MLQQQLDLVRLEATLTAIAHQQIAAIHTRRMTPLAFPIWAERIRTQVSSEDWSTRVERMVLELEKAATRDELKPPCAPSAVAPPAQSA